MIQDYKNLKKHCEVSYLISVKLKNGIIKDREFKVGSLFDTQLDIAKQKLERKSKLTEKEKEQLNAVNYIIDYRSKCVLENLHNEIVNRYIDRATKIANNTRLWNEPIGISIKTIENIDFNGVLKNK